MCGYKFRLIGTVKLSKDIKKQAMALAKSRNNIKRLNGTLKPLFKSLNKAKIKLTKFDVPKTKLKKKDKTFKNLNSGKILAVNGISATIRYESTHLLNEIDSMTSDLSKIILDASTILYRENKTLSKLQKEVNKIKDSNLSNKIRGQLNILKEELKSAARRLYFVTKDPNILKKPFSKKKKIPISKIISKLGIEAAHLEKALEKLKVTNIDEITKKAEKELADIKKIEFVLVSLVPEFKAYIFKIRGDLYMLESSSASRLEERLTNSENRLDKTLDKISKQAEKLFEEIVIVKKIK